ncbi:MAG: divergent PAP2 family protein, partial [bacterium]|nr:divergent PAP2 family protein [bacterium]
LKVMFYYIKEKHFRWERLIGSGGMPSAHAAIVTSLAAAVIRFEGARSALAAVTIIVALIVMYDAAGVRQAAGKQAEVLNRMIADFPHYKQVSEIPLKELLGHTPIEVVVGAILGVVIAYWP